MRFKEWIQEIFFTAPQLVTGKRFVRWSRVAIAGVTISLVLMICIAVFGNSKPAADEKSYQTLSNEEISKNGVVILTGGDYEVRKRSSSGRSSSSGAANAGSDQSQIVSRKDRARSEYIMPAGSKVFVILDGDLNSELSQSPVVVQTKEAFSFQGRVLIPSGSKILGHSADAQNSERLGIRFDQIVYPNGHQISVSGAGMMPDGSPGVVGDLHSSRSLQIAGALGSSFIAGASSAFQTTSPNIFGIQQPEGSTRNAILNGVAQATLDQGKRFGDEAQQSKGYVTIASGSPFYVYFEKEVDLSGVLE